MGGVLEAQCATLRSRPQRSGLETGSYPKVCRRHGLPALNLPPTRPHGSTNGNRAAAATPARRGPHRGHFHAPATIPRMRRLGKSVGGGAALEFEPRILRHAEQGQIFAESDGWFRSPGTGLVVVDVMRWLVERRLPQLVVAGVAGHPQVSPCLGRTRVLPVPPCRGRVSIRLAPGRAIAGGRMGSTKACDRT